MFLIQYNPVFGNKVYYGDHNRIACYSSRVAANKTLNRIKHHMKIHNHPPPIQNLCMISGSPFHQFNNEFSIIYTDEDHLKLICSLNKLSMLFSYDLDGLFYKDVDYIDMGNDVYKEYLNTLIES